MLCQENRLKWYITWLSDRLQMWKEFLLNCHFLGIHAKSFAAIGCMIMLNRYLDIFDASSERRVTVAFLWSTLGHHRAYSVVLDLASNHG